MTRRMALLLSVSLACVVFIGCAPGVVDRASQEAQRSPAIEKPVESDPLVTAAVRRFDANEAPATSGRIIGYLADWRKNLGSGGVATLELIVKTDGSVYRIAHEPGTVDAGPSGKHGRKAPARLGPEPAAVAAARQQALNRATAQVEKKLPDMTDAKLDVFMYLVRVSLEDGTYQDVWVEPSDGSSMPASGRLQEWDPNTTTMPRAERRPS